MKTKLTLFVAALAVALFGMGCATTEPAFVSDGLVTYYPFNGNAKDESGNGNDGTVSGATLTTDRNDMASKAYSFNGSSTYISVSHAAGLNLASTFTISVWAARGTIGHPNLGLGHPGWGLIISKRRTSTNPHGDGYGLAYPTTGGWNWGAGPWDAVDTLNYTGSPGYNPEKWHHLVYSYDGIKEEVYFNGVLVMDRLSSGVPVGNTQPLTIGGQNGSWNRRVHNGKIDDVRIYNRALSAEEVIALHDLEKPKGK